MSDAVTLSLTQAQDLLTRAFTAGGVSQDAARATAAALVAAEADGQVGHGFSRVADYIAQAQSHKVNPAATARLTTPRPAQIDVDADHGFAYPALELGVRAAIAKAQEMGICSLSVKNSHHCGSLSVQVEKIAQAGLISIMVANTPKAIAPFGGAEPLFGTNPIAFAAPRPKGSPLVIDMSLSVVARGKVMNAAKLGKPIPTGWALDAQGQDTTDPDAALAGSMTAIGGAKGTALALIVEVLSALVTGANTSTEASSFFSADGPPPGVGQFLILLRPTDDAGRFADRLEALLTQIEAQEGTRIPGAKRFAMRAASEEHGLSVPRHYIDTIHKIIEES